LNEWTGIIPKEAERLRRSGGGIRLGLVLLEDGESLSNLRVQGLLVVEKVKKLIVIHLEQHARDLAGELGLGAGKRLTIWDKRVLNK
jgi:hypothetical protein